MKLNITISILLFLGVYLNLIVLPYVSCETLCTAKLMSCKTVTTKVSLSLKIFISILPMKFLIALSFLLFVLGTKYKVKFICSHNAQCKHKQDTMINNTTYRMVIYYLFIQFSLFYTAGLACSVMQNCFPKAPCSLTNHST